MRSFLIATLSTVALALPVHGGDIPGVTSRTLPNGLEVIVIENHAVPVVTVEVAVRSGGFVESPEYSGLSHLYEHMFFKGNRVLPSQEQYQKRLREMGAGWNGSTQTERVNYFLTVASEKTREATAFLRDALFYPLFQQKELERERVVVLGEFDRNEANPGFHLNREINRKLWYRTFSRKDVIGDREIIVTAPREKMVTLKERYYVPNNSALLFAGDVQPEEAYAMAEEMLGDWKPAPDSHKAFPEPPNPPLVRSSLIAVVQPVETTAIQQTWLGPSITEDTASTFAADVLTFIISQPNSHFYKNLVDSGLFDSISLSYFSQAHTGPISAVGVTSADRADRAWTALQNELTHLTDPDYFTDEDLAFAKNQTEYSEIYGRELPSNFIHTVSFWWASAGLDYYRNYIDNLRKVSRSDIQNYVRRYISGKPSVTGALISEKDLGKVAFLKTAEVIHPQKGSSATAMMASTKSGSTTEKFDVGGVPVILRRNAQSDVVSVRAFLQGGLPFAGAKRAGLELLMLEVAEKQSANYPKDTLGRELTRLGASLASSATPDYSTFDLAAPRENFAASARIFADALVHPLFTDSEVALARQRRLTTLRLQEETPDSYVSRLAIENANGDSPYALDPLGTTARISAATASQLADLHKSTVSRSRLLIVVVGNVSKEEVTAALAPALKDLPIGDYKAVATVSGSERDTAAMKLSSRDLPTVYGTGVYPGPTLASKDYPATLVGVAILANRLFEEIRTKRNLSYAPGAWLDTTGSGSGVLYFTSPKPNEVIGVMRDEIQKMQNESVPADDVRDAIASLRTDMLVTAESSSAIAGRLGKFELLGGGWENWDKTMERIEEVTPAQVQQAMGHYAHHVDFALLGNVKDVDRKLLESF